ncbi:hypothetical protein CQA53_02465 [Helicobacter didelphidarum]|uniref:Fucosyltransferase C-terminal domain-containing protein n=1 Tax=Helicobacter didelphidarum TaxID=2040648 RepID=A0A3D8IRB0_9HELI|nr:glycosyltransferase family 10 [Helicobacter didelphidarum]RDU67134.1 hypothetical protein CQA53_02465 [Helicobacter didelphidarum]
MRIRFVQDFIDFIRNKKNRLSFQHEYYGKCYYPPYNKKIRFNFTKPKIYNKDGRLMDIFFLRSAATSYSPYNNSKYFLWDRYNFGLDIHFYTDNDIFQTMGGGIKKFALFGEPRSINKKIYAEILKSQGLAAEFTSILTHDEEILNKYPNAMLICGSSPWCYLESGDPRTYNEKKFEIKNKEVSMIISGKNFTPLHKIRNTIADNLKNNTAVDLFGAYVNKGIQYSSEALDTYRYHIAIENQQSEYYFTEKILNCFISMSVPIYLGATRIGKFFNTDGIIQISPNDINNLDNIIKTCNEKDYQSRLSAIIDNYERSLHYLNIDDILYEKLFLNSKK